VIAKQKQNKKAKGTLRHIERINKMTEMPAESGRNSFKEGLGTKKKIWRSRGKTLPADQSSGRSWKKKSERKAAERC